MKIHKDTYDIDHMENLPIVLFFKSIMDYLKTKTIDKKILNLLTKNCRSFIYEREEYIVYAGQIPKVAFIFINGEAEVRLSRCRKLLRPMSIIGFNELMLRKPYKYTIRIFPKTKLLIIDNSSLEKILALKIEKDDIEQLIQITG